MQLMVIWKVRNLKWFQGKSSSIVIQALIERMKLPVGYWVSTLPHFQDCSLDLLVFRWREVAFP